MAGKEAAARRPHLETDQDPSPEQISSWVTAAKAGEEGAFGNLVKANSSNVLSLARRMTGNEDDAEDVAQEAFLRAFRGLKRFRGDAKFSTWMHRITANCANTLLAKRRSPHEELSDDALVPDQRPESDPQAMALAEVDRVQLTSALRGLSPKLRDVVVLRDVYELSGPSIAHELGISLEATKVRLHRARRMLREKLFSEPEKSDEHELFPTQG